MATWIVIGVIGLILVELLNRNNLKFFAFIIKVNVLFLVTLVLFGDMIEKIIITQIIELFKIAEQLTDYYSVYDKAKIITVFAKNSTATFFFDYECTGLIEILVYISLVISYPLFSFWEKIRHIITGYIYLMLTNIIRVIIIIAMLLIFGRDSLFISHMVIARLFYFIMVVILYFTVFTEKHIMTQRVGKIR